jgi:hypothetical protein
MEDASIAIERRKLRSIRVGQWISWMLWADAKVERLGSGRRTGSPFQLFSRQVFLFDM